MPESTTSRHARNISETYLPNLDRVRALERTDNFVSFKLKNLGQYQEVDLEREGEERERERERRERERERERKRERKRDRK